MFAPSLSTQNLIDLCRVLRHNLSAGLTLRHVFRQQAGGGARAVRPLAARVLEAIDQGQSLSAALQNEPSLPPLFRAMAKVGEQTGHLPEIFGTLERHYLLEQKLRRQIIRQSMGTVVQFVFALFIIAGLIFILGILGQSRPGTAPITIIPGLSGGSGALIFLGISFGSIALVFAAFKLFMRYPRQAAPVQAFLLRLPALGPALMSLVMSRFTMALKLTLDSGLAIVKALKLSLEATGNAWFISKTDIIARSLKGGDSLSAALTQAGLFEEEFLHIVVAAEEGGRVPEMMEHQAEYWNEEASRRLTTLARIMTLTMWLLYAGFMVFMIFRIAGVYLNMFQV